VPLKRFQLLKEYKIVCFVSNFLFYATIDSSSVQGSAKWIYHGMNINMDRGG